MTKMPERIWATPLGEPDGGFWYSPCADKTDKTEYVLATTNQRTLEALREAAKALERFNRGGITLFGNEEDVPVTFKGKDFKALRAALRAKGGGNGERDTSIEDHGGLIEARSVATGEAPAARIHVNGHAYVPATTHAATLAELREAATDTLASLVAAVSLLERGGKRAAPSDKMFHTMLADYNASIKRARAALARIKEAT